MQSKSQRPAIRLAIVAQIIPRLTEPWKSAHAQIPPITGLPFNEIFQPCPIAYCISSRRDASCKTSPARGIADPAGRNLCVRHFAGACSRACRARGSHARQDRMRRSLTQALCRRRRGTRFGSTTRTLLLPPLVAAAPPTAAFSHAAAWASRSNRRHIRLERQADRVAKLARVRGPFAQGS